MDRRDKRMEKIHRAVFIDRDGTMGANASCEYPFEFIPFDGLKQAIGRLQKAGYLAIAITNQSCVARGKGKGYDFDKELASYGLDDWFICPHDDQDNCGCRKPKPGLILQAQKKYSLSLPDCIMIGDRWTDINTGKSVGCKGVLVLTGRGKEEVLKENSFSPDSVQKDIFSAIDWIIKEAGV